MWHLLRRHYGPVCPWLLERGCIDMLWLRYIIPGLVSQWQRAKHLAIPTYVLCFPPASVLPEALHSSVNCPAFTHTMGIEDYILKVHFLLQNNQCKSPPKCIQKWATSKSAWVKISFNGSPEDPWKRPSRSLVPSKRRKCHWVLNLFSQASSESGRRPLLHSAVTFLPVACILERKELLNPPFHSNHRVDFLRLSGGLCETCPMEAACVSSTVLRRNSQQWMKAV